MRKLLTVALFLGLLDGTLQAQNNTGKGAALGGVAGAVVGGIIGHQNKETPEGALIGGAVGAIAGGVIGHQKDQQIAREQQYRRQVYHQHRSAEQMRRAVSVSDVITMTRSGVSDTVIVSHIESNGVQRRPEVSDILAMHQQGVSEYVISAMERSPAAGTTTYTYPSTPVYTSRPYAAPTYAAPVYGPGTVIVHEHVTPTYIAPPPVYTSRSYHYPSHSYHRRGF